MTTIAFDPRMGASGDMFVGALLDVGADRRVLEPIEHALGVRFEVGTVVSQGIAATTVSVGYPERAQDAEGHGPHRTYAEVVDIVGGMNLEQSIERRAVDAFRLLGEAEAAVHGTSLEEMHFHEVGADDAIADVTGAVALLADLDVSRVLTTTASTGTGEVDTSHGTYPIPPPAVAEIASRSSFSLRGGPVEGELLTPTGATLLGTLGAHVETIPALSIETVGYGAGDRSFPGRPNVLRVLVGEETGRLVEEDIAVLETNVDDVTPEVIGELQRQLNDVGALDVSVSPLTMKKSRPGHLIRVIATPEDEERIARRLARETGTLGVRAVSGAHRWVADREMRTVDVEIGGGSHEIGVKIARDRTGDIFDISAEFDDARRVAEQTNRPVRKIMRLAELSASESA